MDRQRAAVVTVAALGLSNVMTNRVLPDATYVPWNLTVAAGLVSMARRAGCSDEELGLDRRYLGPGARLGAGLAAAVVVAHAAAWTSTRGRAAFDDRRVTELDTGQARYHALVRIPLGTALAEEVFFRGVLPAVLASPRHPSLARWGSSGLFGLWHVLPSQLLAGRNQRAGRLAARAGPAALVSLAVAGTAVAGVALHEARRRGRHLVAPVLVHLAINLSGFLGARALRSERGRTAFGE